jgi:hypothetical protein
MCKVDCLYKKECPLFNLRRTKTCWYSSGNEDDMPLRKRILTRRKELIEQGLIKGNK